MTTWPAALFCFVFVFLAALQLARGERELAIGIGLAVAASLGVLFVSTSFLVAAGFAIVALGWKRERGVLAKKRPKRSLSFTAGPSTPGTAMVAVSEGLVEARILASAAGMTPWEDTEGREARNEAEALVFRAGRNNPFRPEGPIGHRVGMHTPGTPQPMDDAGTPTKAIPTEAIQP